LQIEHRRLIRQREPNRRTL